MNNHKARYPRYVTVYDQLLHDIQGGVYMAGDKLPGENELARKFNVSRNTLRQAVLLLHEDGYVSNHQGKGTFVLNNRPPKNESLEKLINPLMSLSVEPVSRVETRIEIRQTSPKNQEVFNIDASKLLVLVETVYYCGDNRVGCGLSFVPYDLFSNAHVPLDDTERVGKFYNELLAVEGLVAESSLRIVKPRNPVTGLLVITSHEQLFMLDEVIRDRKGSTVMTQKLFMIPNAYEITFVRKNERGSSIIKEKI